MKYILISLLLTLLVGCKDKNDSGFISKDEYEGYLKYPPCDLCKSIPNSERVKKDLTFFFNLKCDLDLNENDYEFMIIMRGFIYRGVFSKSITVKDVCIEKDDFYPFAFIMLDKTNKILYKWYKKESYSLLHRNTIKVVLSDDGTYRIKLRK